ncbi:MAG TPA: ABC transporter substrate-binding protein [Gryllotalpicola sp.]
MKYIPRSRRLVAAAVSVLAAAALLTGCSTNSSSLSDSKTPGTASITIQYPTDIESMNPYAHSSSVTYSRWSNVMEPLVDYDYSTGKYVGVLAESWEDSGTSWTFHLRKGVKFQSGADFTSADVIWSINRMINDPKSLQADHFTGVTSYTAPDDYTVVITTKTPNPTLLLNLPNSLISSKTTYEKYAGGDDFANSAKADAHPDGTGPYSFVSYQTGVSLTVKKNPHYWGKLGADTPETMIFKVINSTADAVAALQRGEVDIVQGLSDTDTDTITKNKDKVISVDGTRTMFLAFNPKANPLFADVRVRQAISEAIDVSSITKNIFHGEFTQSADAIPPAIYGAPKDLKPYKYDPADAKAKLAAAGATGATVQLTTPTGRYPHDVEVAQAVVQYLNDVGLKASVLTPDFATLSSDMSAGKLGFFQISRGGYNDASQLLNQYFRTGDTKRTEYSNSKVDALLNAAQSEPDDTKRLADLQQAQQLIVADAPAVFFGAYKDIYGTTSKIAWKPDASQEILGKDITVG